MTETSPSNISVQQQSIPPDIAVAANQETAVDKTEPDKEFAPSNIARLKAEAPDIFDSAVIKAIQSQMFHSLKRSGNRVAKAMKKARQELERR